MRNVNRLTHREAPPLLELECIHFTKCVVLNLFLITLIGPSPFFTIE